MAAGLDARNIAAGSCQTEMVVYNGFSRIRTEAL